MLYRVTSLCKSVHFVFYFYTRSLFFENCCTVSLFLQPVHPNHFCYVRNLLVCIFVDHSHPICLILFFANNHSESLFFCKLRSLRMECQESPIRERQDCSKRVPFEAKPVWMEWKGGPFEEIKSMKSAKLYKLVDYWTGELYFEHSGSHRLGLCESWWGPCEGKFQVELSGETWCFASGAWCLVLGFRCLVLGGVNWGNVTIYPAPYKSR